MKKKSTYFLLLCIFIPVSYSQTSLKWHNITAFEPRAISVDPYRNNLLWLTGNGGLFRYDISTNSWTSFNTAEGLSKIWGRSLYIEEDKIWVGTEGHGANLFDLQNERFTPFLQYCTEGYSDDNCPSVLSIYPEGNNIWIGTMNDGLYLVDKTTFDTLKHFTKYDGLGDDCIYSILDDGQFLWLATAYCGVCLDFCPPNGGITRLNKSSFEIENFRLPYEESNNYFYSLTLIDNTLWAAGSMGLFTFDRASGRFSRILEDQISSAEYIAADGDNIWCIGASVGYNNLFKINKNTKQIQDSLQISVSSLAMGTTHLYLTVGDYIEMNLYKMEKSSFELELIPNNFLPSPYCYGVDGDEDFTYAGTGNYIVKIDNDNYSYSVLEEPEENIRSITIDGEYLWVCTDNGLLKYNKNQPSEPLKKYLTSEIAFFAVNRNNYIWVSTHLGLYRIDKINDQITKKDFTSELNTFGTPKISDIIFDGDNLWLCFSGTQNGGGLISGIIEINSQTLSTVRLKEFPIGDYTQSVNNLIDIGDYFLAGGKEIYKINKSDLSFETFINQQTDKILLRDTLLWVTAHFDGIKVFDINTKEEKFHIIESNGLLHNYVTDFSVSDTDAFFTTYGGISILELSSLLNITNTLKDYFPLQVGNSWTYTGSQDTLYKRTYFIKDSLQIGQFKYFVYGNENLDLDTLRKDTNGNVYRLMNGEDLLWLDFTKNDGEVYDYILSDTFKVTVSKNILAETYLGNFYNCTQFFFNIPEAVDDETIYLFAPGIGLVKKYGGWSDDILFYATVNNTPMDVDEKGDINYSYSLFQNYPNPFNPTTNIGFRIVHFGLVTLKVYDILGKEVAIILNEELAPGEYHIPFSAEGMASPYFHFPLSSGIYFYKLQAGDYSSTKKMIYLK